MGRKARTRGFGTRAPVAPKPVRPRWHFVTALIIGAGGAAATAAVSFGAAWVPSSTSSSELRVIEASAVAGLSGIGRAPVNLPPPMPEDTPFEMAAPPMKMEASVREIRNFQSSGIVALAPNWIFGTEMQMPQRAPGQSVASAALPDASDLAGSATPKGAVVAMAHAVPLPTSDPRGAGRSKTAAVPADDAPDAMASGDLAAEMPKPEKNPLARKVRLASLSTGEGELDLGPTEPPQVTPEEANTIPMSSAEVRLPRSGDRFAVYDIVGQTVYMPDGTKFEAHSGYGDKFDDPRHISVKMLGPTPPNTYRLTMRESLFHGVEALRMTPVGKEPMYGRNGILTHTYLLGARGDSNGCISFKNYEAFLAHWKKGKVDHMVVVARLPNDLKPNKGVGSMFAWLKPKSARTD
ncbi:DUF2778 domain-containing protein [Ancylobacter sp. Lp-2]|uniref:DUF2778 domain-containing protein n=1 Tax=Ancylobacter sp. Lp-2 TaxID=2881339 RepID=UPI001E33F334|nr:DUF2778 domain-containing protein [Ancylobacter sp. Lp-2]MCB4769892.1 DUF2778 domain-containing protein [Ancylobacter sp. Lp-2]